jgi:hypothetical protein
MRTRQNDLLAWDAAGIQDYLDEFDDPSNGEARQVEINSTGELLVIRNMPLPDGFRPDHIDLLLMVDQYPGRPPNGIYLLERDNGSLIGQLRRVFNVMQTAVHSAPSVPGFVWICVHYAGDTWRYNSDRLAAGDNLRKFIIHFYNRCQSEGSR